MFRIAILFIGFLGWVPLSAQIFPTCVDSLAAMPFYQCPDVQFYPVCGCNNETYRNECEARFRNGVLTYTPGPCSGFEFDILPTYVSGASNYATQFTIVQTGIPNFARLFVIDVYGRLWHQQELPAATRFTFSLDLLELKWGVYYIYVYDTKGTYRYQGFVKVP